MGEKENIFGSILYIAQLWTAKSDALLKEKIGITTKQWMLLVILSKHFAGKNPTISQASKEFGSSRQNLKQVALSLQRKGFIRIKHDKNDARIQRIILTGKHEAFFEGNENEQWQQKFINNLLQNFSEVETSQLNSFVEKLKDNI
jgi:DNA-binding MarR family transcriptional regulator